MKKSNETCLNNYSEIDHPLYLNNKHIGNNSSLLSLSEVRKYLNNLIIIVRFYYWNYCFFFQMFTTAEDW